MNDTGSQRRSSPRAKGLQTPSHFEEEYECPERVPGGFFWISKKKKMRILASTNFFLTLNLQKNRILELCAKIDIEMNHYIP
eukprot:m.113096 g.113096  ORF g.113096 m.113096 type:complete len:82 (+) comp28244_c0_seq2:282-527(+)